MGGGGGGVGGYRSQDECLSRWSEEVCKNGGKDPGSAARFIISLVCFVICEYWW